MEKDVQQEVIQPDTVKSQIFVQYTHFRTCDLNLVRANKNPYVRGPQNKITLKFKALKTNINFHTVLI